MPQFFITFLVIVCSLSLVIKLIGEVVSKGKCVDIDSQYLDEDGDHIYYERSLIEKKTFRKLFPDITDLRSFKQLFRVLAIKPHLHREARE